MPTSLRQLRYALLATVACAGAAKGDDIYTYGSNGALPTDALWRNVVILRVEDDKLAFRTRGGDTRTLDLATIFHVALPSDPVLSKADEAFAGRRWDEAIDGYQRILDGGDASWKSRYVAPRLLLAASRADRFDAALVAFIATARLDPKSAAAAKPTLPSKGSKYLDDAAKAVNAAVRTATTDAERQTLLSFLLEVQMVRGDAEAIAATTDQLAAAAGQSTIAGNPKLAGIAAEVRMTQARALMQAARYAEAIASINEAAGLIVDPGRQAEALTIIADARAALADQSADVVARRDAAIAYLRIVAHLSDEPAAAGFLPRALLAAGRQQAAAGDVDAARALYDQVRAEYPNASAANEAAALAAKLPASAGG